MSTNRPDGPTAGLLPAGLPDPATLARMAADFFGALPGAAGNGGVQESGGTLRAVPQPTVANGFPAAVPTPQATVPAIPSGSFSFLESARPAFSPPVSAAPAIAAATPAGASSAVFGSAPSPTVPGSLGGVESAVPAPWPPVSGAPPVPGVAAAPATPAGASPAVFGSAPSPTIPGSLGGIESAVPAPWLPVSGAPPVPGAAAAPAIPAGSSPAVFGSAPSPTVPGSLGGVISVVPVPWPPVSGAPPVPGAAAAPATPAGASSAIFGSGPSPTVPGSLGGVESAVPAFSFLEEARSAFSNPVSAVAPLPAVTLAAPDANGIPLSSQPFDVASVRRDFPLLGERVKGRPLVWLDNGATTQKPQSVIDRLGYFYAHENSNVHRAAHEMAARATDAYESAREKVRRFLNAPASREIVFVRGATEGINLVAQSWGRQNIGKDDEIVVSWLEHHANIVPWQMLASEKGARLRVAPVDDRGQIILDEYEKLLGPRTRLVSVTQVSNALGTVTPVTEIVQAARRHGATVLIDGAQAVSHMRVDVQALGCDFYVFSGHKVFAPTGIGAVWGRSEILDVTQPWQGGGNMIQDVTFEKTVYNAAPARFEAGTGNIADAVGLGAAIDYLERVGMENVSRHEHDLLRYGTQLLEQVPGLRIIGTAPEKAAVLSFVIEGIPTAEIGDYLNQEGIAVRSGHHCAQPILRRFGLESTVRATLALYNTYGDLDALAGALQRLQVSRRNRG